MNRRQQVLEISTRTSGARRDDSFESTILFCAAPGMSASLYPPDHDRIGRPFHAF